MNLMDAIKEKGDPFWIPDCSRDDLPEFFKVLGFKVGAEIGVYFGENLEKYCKAGLTMYGVDPWKNDRDYQAPFPTKGHIIAKNPDEIFNLATQRLSLYPNCKLIRKTSMTALDDIPDRSLDFVYIDGNHEFGYVAMDLMKWTEKVRKGGVIAGHDYFLGRRPNRKTRMVHFVVDAFAKAYDFNNWYVLGSENPSPEEKSDRALSFMFFKHR